VSFSLLAGRSGCSCSINRGLKVLPSALVSEYVTFFDHTLVRSHNYVRPCYERLSSRPPEPPLV
jgi:hypothetical protein